MYVCMYLFIYLFIYFGYKSKTVHLNKIKDILLKRKNVLTF